MISAHLLLATTIVVAATAVGLALLVVLAKLVRSRRERALEAMLAPHRRSMLVVGSGEDDDGSALAHLLSVEGRTWEHLGPAVSAMLSKVRGAPADDLVLVLREHGDVARALVDLGARSVITRARAARLLGLVRDRDHVPELVRLLSDPSPEVRLVAVRALGAIGDPAAARDVLRALRSVRGHVGVPAYLVAEALLSMGTGSTPALLEGLGSDDATVRNAAALVCGRATVASSAARLRELLDDDPDPEVRTTAAVSLGMLGGSDDVVALARHTLTSEPATLRRTCAAALGELGHPLGTDALAALLDDPDRRLAEMAAEALAQLGTPGTSRLEQAAGDESVPQAARAARAALALARLRLGHGAVA